MPADVLLLHQGGGAGSEPVEPVETGSLLAELQRTLTQLRQVLLDALGTRSTAKESRQWLLNSIASLDLADPPTQRRRWAAFLPGAASCRGAEHAAVGQAMLQLLFAAAPAEVGALIARDASLLRHYFQSDAKRAPLWFSHFSMEGMRRFKYGAAALAQYALAHRDEMWHLLAWQGRHSQAPVAVAQRPHYFCELDVPRTLRHLLKDCPGFWSSRELRQSVESGAAELLALSPAWWSRELLRWLQDSLSAAGDRLHALLCRCLEAGPWRQHCHALLHLLPQQDLSPFAADLLGGTRLPGSGGGAAAGPAEQPAAGPAPLGAWLVFRGAQWPSLGELELASALGCSQPLLLRLLRDDEQADERRQVEQLVDRLLGLEQQPGEPGQAAAAAHWRLRRQLAQQRGTAAETELRQLLLLSLFAAAFTVQRLSSSGSEADARQLEQLLTASGLPCRLAPAAGEAAGGRRRSSSAKKHGKHSKRRRGSSGKSSKKKKRRRRSRDASDSGSGSDSDGSGSDAEEGWLGGLLEPGEEAVVAGRLWQLQRPESGGAWATLSGVELADAVTNAAAAAHVRWLSTTGAGW